MYIITPKMKYDDTCVIKHYMDYVELIKTILIVRQQENQNKTCKMSNAHSSHMYMMFDKLIEDMNGNKDYIPKYVFRNYLLQYHNNDKDINDVVHYFYKDKNVLNRNDYIQLCNTVSFGKNVHYFYCYTFTSL